MLLTIDIGNSQIVSGVFKGGKLMAMCRLGTVLHKTSEEYGILLMSILKNQGVVPGKIRGAILSSVVPALTTIFEEMVKSHFSVLLRVVTPALQSGLTILYDRPEEVGADRIVNAAAAHSLFGRRGHPLIIVDFGTATTFDLVSDSGDYLGGAIAPGLVVSSDALFSHTAKLPRVELTVPRSAVGKNTASSIQSGLIFGHVGLVHEMVRRIAEEVHQTTQRPQVPTVIATGGFAEMLAPLCSVVSIVRPTLTLEGLMIIYTMNFSRGKEGNGQAGGKG